MGIIDIKDLNKSYRDVKAVRDLSFTVKEGELFAFLGVNGAGKSTTINIICGQLEKDSGTVTVDGMDIDTSMDRIKSEIGVVFQGSPFMTILSAVRLFTALLERSSRRVFRSLRSF